MMDLKSQNMNWQYSPHLPNAITVISRFVAKHLLKL